MDQSGKVILSKGSSCLGCYGYGGNDLLKRNARQGTVNVINEGDNVDMNGIPLANIFIMTVRENVILSEK